MQKLEEKLEQMAGRRVEPLVEEEEDEEKKEEKKRGKEGYINIYNKKGSKKKKNKTRPPLINVRH